MYRIQNLPRQSSLQELPIQADTIHELIEDRSQLARLLPERRRKTRWEQREWSVNQTDPWDRSLSWSTHLKYRLQHYQVKCQLINDVVICFVENLVQL